MRQVIAVSDKGQVELRPDSFAEWFSPDWTVGWVEKDGKRRIRATIPPITPPAVRKVWAQMQATADKLVK